MEYGSDFSIEFNNLEYCDDNVFSYLNCFNLLLFDSGRSAIRYLLNTIKRDRIALPAYICESVVNCFDRNSVVDYQLDDSLKIEFLDAIPWGRIDAFYLVHYFGHLQPKYVLDYILDKKQKYGFIIIEDTTHSLFSNPVTIGDFCVCSLRKWFPIPDGGVLYSRKSIPEDHYMELDVVHSDRIKGMILKALYLDGFVIEKEFFREIMVRTEAALDKQKAINRMSDISDFILRCQSVGQIAKKRRENYDLLAAEIGELFPAFSAYTEEEVPFIYVAKTADRDSFKSYLIDKHVYCPVHWQLPKGSGPPDLVDLSDQLISIPIDQRYSATEVLNTASIIKGYCNE